MNHRSDEFFIDVQRFSLMQRTLSKKPGPAEYRKTAGGVPYAAVRYDSGTTVAPSVPLLERNSKTVEKQPDPAPILINNKRVESFDEGQTIKAVATVASNTGPLASSPLIGAGEIPDPENYSLEILLAYAYTSQAMYACYRARTALQKQRDNAKLQLTALYNEIERYKADAVRQAAAVKQSHMRLAAKDAISALEAATLDSPVWYSQVSDLLETVMKSLDGSVPVPSETVDTLDELEIILERAIRTHDLLSIGIRTEQLDELDTQLRRHRELKAAME